jgi:tetratricopeptide (TPR) repeat protein
MKKKLVVQTLLLFFFSIGYAQNTTKTYEKASAFFEEKNYFSAIQELNTIIRLNPKHIKAIVLRGMSKHNLKDERGAISDFTLVINIDKNYADAYFLRGVSRILNNQKEEGCRDLSKAGELGIAEAYTIIESRCRN